MDKLIAAYDSVELIPNLMICPGKGIAYQADMSRIIEYGRNYFENYINREGTIVAYNLNKARTGLTEKYCKCICDMGIGSGEFIKSSKIKTYGYDINPYGIEWLQQRGIYVDPYQEYPDDIEGFSLWDTLEHIPKPHEFFARVKTGHFLFISLPIIEDVTQVPNWKHFKETEHLYYFERDGLINWMIDHGFKLVEHNDDETKAGRFSIGSFVFLK